MVDQQFSQDTDNRVIAQIHENMAVYDTQDKLIGHVSDLYMGASSPQASQRGEGPATAPARDENNVDSLIEDVARSIFGSDNMPDDIRARLLQNGFVSIGGQGLFSAIRYILPDQIASVSSDRVTLNIAGDSLIKR